jgi:hypothetical protein
VTAAARTFLPLPDDEPLKIAWPTPNRFLFVAPEKFFATTRRNPDYGRPGWTRDCGKRFHGGCDIAPIFVERDGKTARVVFTDCETGRDFESEEPTFVPKDDVFCVFDGEILQINDDENASDYGKFVKISHVWPKSREKFVTLYAHLSEIFEFFPRKGARVGRMGQTSRSRDSRNWMRIAPHLHFEVQTMAGKRYDPEQFLRRFLPR